MVKHEGHEGRHEGHEGREGEMLTRARSTLSAETERVAEAAIGCALEVHRRLGPGFKEGLYQDAMAIELEEAGLAGPDALLS